MNKCTETIILLVVIATIFGDIECKGGGGRGGGGGRSGGGSRGTSRGYGGGVGGRSSGGLDIGSGVVIGAVLGSIGFFFLTFCVISFVIAKCCPQYLICHTDNASRTGTETNRPVTATVNKNGKASSVLPSLYDSVVIKAQTKTNNKTLKHAGVHGEHVWTTSKQETLPPTTIATINETKRWRNHPTRIIDLNRKSRAKSDRLPYL